MQKKERPANMWILRTPCVAPRCVVLSDHPQLLLNAKQMTLR